MPRVRKEAKNDKEKEAGEPKPPKVDFYLDDGHPNPAAMSVWDFMQELSEEQWTEYVGYLYRVQPRKQPTDRPAYIAVVSAPITLEDVKRLYGGQKFTIHFNRRIGKRQKGIYTVQFDIEAEAIPQDGEIFEKPLAPGRASQAATGGTDATVLEGLTNLISNLVAQNAEAQRTGQPFDSTAAITEALKIQSQGATAAIEMMKNKEGSGGKEDQTILKMVLPILLERAFKPPQENSTVDQIRAVLELTNELRPRGGGSSGPENAWVALAQGVGPRLDPILEKIASIVQNWAVISMSKNPAAMAQIQKAVAPAAASAAAAPANASPGAAPAAEAPAGAQPTPEQIQKYNRSVITDQIKKAIVQMLFDGGSGDLAAEVAEKMDPEFAVEFAGILQKDIASLTADPILAPAVTAPRLAEFVSEYLSFFAQEAPIETEAAPAASPEAA